MMITDGALIAPGLFQGLFNSVNEGAWDLVERDTPTGTEWAFASLNGKPAAGSVTMSNYKALNFSTWEASLGGMSTLAGNILNRAGVVYITAEDIYLNIEFTSWGGGGSALFAYPRSTTPPVPVPAALPLLLSGIGYTARRKQRACA